ncbi:DUF4932 domain-containing protein [Paraglaciecola arctica]|uniref:DUF4932 domain-containing protein n=1 Tax=Paraglaciecola arctica TaxID=1128911 RepID=UPI001C06A6F1|nr:DUF4932 domain-containing protein [Paraglaciecola arctica]MBU3002081.1 DUF4932 domain-containing protein [Paraglaciecola arctica]
MKYLIFVFMLLGCANSRGDDHYINLQGDSFVLVTDKYFSRELSFNSLPTDKAFYMTYWGASPTAELRYGEQSVPIFYRGNDSEKLYLQLNNQVKTLTFHIQGKPVRYSTRYIQQQRGKVTADIPEVYELTNIVLALADKFHQTNYGRRVQGDYYQAMMKWFTPFKAHPIFTALGDVDYYSLVENGPAYEFMNDKIVKSEVYNSFRAKDAIAMQRELLENFAKISDFRSFYQQHQPYYSSLLKQFENDTQPKRIWSWLESEFPAEYQSYKVFFSPLGSGKHSARMFTHNGFKESIMFISGPNRYESGVDSPATKAIKLTRTLFTEIDHAYVNPISDNYINEINDALPELKNWYKGGGYNKPYLVFNEYMTWSVFLLYALESYSDEEYLMIKHHMEDFMVNKRGFYKFKAFNKELTRIYKKRSQEQTIEDLYEPIIKWLKTH